MGFGYVWLVDLFCGLLHRTQGFETLFEALSILILDECDRLVSEESAETRRRSCQKSGGIYGTC